MAMRTMHMDALDYLPDIDRTPDCWTIRTSPKWGAARLFLSLRKIDIDIARRRVRFLHRRALLFSHTEEIAFEDIAYLDYSQQATPTIWPWIPMVVLGLLTMNLLHVGGQVDTFTLSAVAKDGRRLPLCVFRRERLAGYGPLDIDRGFVEVAGGADAVSRAFIDELTELLGVPFGNTPAELGALVVCPSCKHRVAAKASVCIYCGAETSRTN
ncbi:MAG: hypothetical protein GY851_04335 [bacterium]|nr:hypothetical protein [bacterium]